MPSPLHNNTLTRVKTKICGLKTVQDVEVCVRAKADFIGLVFFPKSPRHLEIDQAQKLAKSAREKTKIVALLVNPDNSLVQQICTHIEPDYIQLHGSESIERVLEIKALCGRKIIKAIGVAVAADFQTIPYYEKVTDLILLDAKPIKGKTDLPGGNGLAFDWELLKNQNLRKPFMLAGGLTPQNVSQAITLTQAPIIDVSSGVESSLGRKDHNKINAFISQTQKQATP